MLIAAKLRAHQEIWDQMVVQFGEENIIPDGPEHYIVNTHFPIEPFTCWFLLSFGDRCECLEPESIRALLRESLELMMKIYNA